MKGGGWPGGGGWSAKGIPGRGGRRAEAPGWEGCGRREGQRGRQCWWVGHVGWGDPRLARAPGDEGPGAREAVRRKGVGLEGRPESAPPPPLPHRAAPGTSGGTQPPGVPVSPALDRRTASVARALALGTPGSGGSGHPCGAVAPCPFTPKQRPRKPRRRPTPWKTSSVSATVGSLGRPGWAVSPQVPAVSPGAWGAGRPASVRRAPPTRLGHRAPGSGRARCAKRLGSCVKSRPTGPPAPHPPTHPRHPRARRPGSEAAVLG